MCLVYRKIFKLLTINNNAAGVPNIEINASQDSMKQNDISQYLYIDFVLRFAKYFIQLFDFTTCNGTDWLW